MGIYTNASSVPCEVDVIIVGGGTTGCVVASRLADADPDMSILVIEAGPNNYHEPSIIHPVLFFQHFSPDSKMNAVYPGKESAALNNRPTMTICGRVLGGGSSINTMMYARGQKSDYNAWNMPGWSSDDILPYLKKFETYHGNGEASQHGSNGPVHVSMGPFRCEKVSHDLMRVVNRAGLPENADLQSLSLDAINGAQHSLRYVSPDGFRQDAAHCYLHPRLRDGEHPNLHVLVETEVIKILIEDRKATGIVCRPNPELVNSEPQISTPKLMARRFVVLCSGAFGSPAVLERSGIGNSSVLESAGVLPLFDLPGVGNNYEDHPFLNYAYHTNLGPEDTSDAAVFDPEVQKELVIQGAPILGHNAQDLGLKLRPDDVEVSSMGEVFKSTWRTHFQEIVDKPLVLMSLITNFPGYEPHREPGQYIGMSVFAAHPFSRGHVHITGPSVSDPIDFDPGFFTDRHTIDIKTHVWAYKRQRELMRRMDAYRGEFASWHPPFASDSKAACSTVQSALPGDISDIEYSAQDDAVIENFIRDKVASLWHSMGTCKMAARENGGVVDGSLSVYRTQGLKIADLSVAPANVAANTASTAYAIGEKAADIIASELGLSLETAF